MGNALLDFGGAEWSITHGHCTVDGTGYIGGGMKDYKMVHKKGSDDFIWTQMKCAPGEGSTGAKSADRRGLSFNSGTDDGDSLSEICIDHCTVSWGPDVVGSFIDETTDCTLQYSLIGPALLNSNNIKENPNGYGWNVTTINALAPTWPLYTKRMTFYRNLYAMNRQRNLKYEHTDGVDAVNCVVYNYNQAPVYGNARGENIIGCIFKKGPESKDASNTDAFEEDGGTGILAYDQFPDSTYHSGNIGRKADGSSMTLDWSRIDPAALRSTPYDGGPTASDHGALSVATADDALFAAVVAEAGRTYQDTVDTLIKAHAMAGTSDGYYNGAGFAAPHPSWGG